MQSLHALARTLLLGLFFTFGLFTETAFAQLEASEYDLKAAFLYQFVSYVTWPAAKDAETVVRIGIVGAPDVVDALTAIVESQAGTGRTVEVRMLTEGADTRDLHVLFLAGAARVDGADLLGAGIENSVLTVTEDAPRPADSVINFEIVDDRVRFDVALDPARRAGLEVSARLLQVALRVVEQP